MEAEGLWDPSKIPNPYNPSTLEVEAGRPGVQSQPEQRQPQLETVSKTKQQT